MGRNKQRNEEENAAGTEAILESISDGVFTVDPEWRITSFNRAAEQITGIARKEALGKPCSEVFRSSMCEGACALRRTLETGKPVINRAGYIVDPHGRRTPISVSTAVLRNRQGQVIGGAETFRDLSEVEALRQELSSRSQLGNLVSHSPAMRKISELIPIVAESLSTVLINGETGTGKELLAQAIHRQSKRAKKPFVAVNCGALPDSLLESELFGYKKGAFTGAVQDKPGLFARADGGTLFLDEIGEISSALQVRLLRFLQERSYEPLGGTRSETADVRIITATHRNLDELVAQGKFREDLFYRINVIRLTLPPLRQRQEDIPLLVENFIDRFNRQQHKNVPGITSGALEILRAGSWPGNVRELENVIERAFVLCGGARIAVHHLPEELTGKKALPPPSGTIAAVVQTTEEQTILAALQQYRNNRSAAAAKLGINRSTLYRKIRGLKLTPPPGDGRHRPY